MSSPKKYKKMFLKKNKKLIILFIVALYFFITSIVSFCFIVLALIGTITNDEGILSLILLLSLLLFTLFLIYINSEILFSISRQKEILKYLVIDKYFTLFQIIQFKIFGFFYFFVFGPEITFYLIKDNSVYTTGVFKEAFQFEVKLCHSNASNVNLVGVNLIVIVVFVIISYLIKSIDKEQLQFGIVSVLKKAYKESRIK